MSVGVRTVPQARDKQRSYWTDSAARVIRDPSGAAAAFVLVALLLVALGAPLLATHVTRTDPDAQDLVHTFSPIGTAGHWLGTDELGRDTLTRLIYGSRVSLGVGLLTVVLYLMIGTTVGLLSGYYGGMIDEFLMRVVDVLLAVPAIYLLIFLTALLPLRIGPIEQPWFIIRHDPLSMAALIAVVSWGRVSRLIRSEVLRVRASPFIEAARSVGAKDRRIIARHIMPNVVPTLIVAASLGVAFVILIEAALDFIGVGVQPPTSSWGNMLTRAQDYYYHSPALVVLPGLLIGVTVFACNLLGNSLRDAFDPRLRH